MKKTEFTIFTITGKGKNIMHLFVMNKKGFVSSFFLILFMYVSMMVTVTALNDLDRMKSMLNLQESNAYLMQETAVLRDVKCMMKSGVMESGQYTADGDISYSLTVEESDLVIIISGDREEILKVRYDPQQSMLVRYNVQRTNTAEEKCFR